MIKKRLIGLLEDSKKHIIRHVLLQILALISQIFLVLVISDVLEEAYAKSLNADKIAFAVAAVIATVVIRVVCEKLQAREAYLASIDVKRVLRDKIYGKLLRLGAAYKEKVSTSEVVQLSSEGVEQLETYFGRYLPQFFYSMISPLILFFVIGFKANFVIGGVLLLAVPLIPISIVAVMKFAKKLLKKYWGLYASLGDSFLENLQGLTTSKIYKADAVKSDEMDVEADHFRRITMKVLTMQLNSITVMDIMAYGGAAVGIITGLNYYLSEKISLSAMMVIIFLAAEFFLPLRLLGSFFHIAMNGMAASDKIFNLLDLPEKEDGTDGLAEENLSIQFRGVDFSYDKERKILSNIDMDIPMGSFVSIVGESGCGKSTIVGIISGRNKGYLGEIKIAGKELSGISEKTLLENIVLVRSNSYLFKGTVAENLRMAKKKATEQELWEVLKKVRLDELMKENDGLETKLQEKGSNLSGGQAQRLALARALLSDAKIMIFDEVTSNIDAESEELIMDIIRALRGERTVIVISHRLHNVLKSDEIYMMERGRIKERGAHEALMKKNGEYARLFNSQKELEDYAAKSVVRPEGIRLDGVKNREKRKQVKEEEKREDRRSGLSIMGSLIGLVAPLLHVMIAAVVLGIVGYLCAIFLTIIGAGVVDFSFMRPEPNSFPVFRYATYAMIGVAVLRGLLHYAEQYCNHYIAFKILALLRNKIFTALRKLCPAKLEGKDKGNLISIITTDIELLEVFYAHTISPIAIAIGCSFIMTVFIGNISVAAGVLAFVSYIIIGAIIPIVNGKIGGGIGMRFRNGVGELSSYVLDELRGIDETIQYGVGDEKKAAIFDRSVELARLQERLAKVEGNQRAMTNLAIQLSSYGMLFLSLSEFLKGNMSFGSAVICTVAMMSSYGPVVALSALSNNLHQTLASGERVLRILEETPMVEEVPNTDGLRFERAKFDGAKVEDISFSYDREPVLENYSLDIKKNRILGIHGPSGCGKSTLLKLLMRFWDTNEGEINLLNEDIKKIPTEILRDIYGYVTQETHLFHDSLANNISLGKPNASLREIQEAAKAASIHDFIMSLPKGYDTRVGELGDGLSSGEKQRIGIARAFLYDAPFILMDEPTSNLDSLNEGIILKALRERRDGKTIMIVSHRDSTMNIVDELIEMT